jgi:uncharacterized SAM-binding protein YcdF (DUF218 family)
MFFSFQKIVWFLVLPPASPIILMLLGLALSVRRRHLGRGLILGGIILLYLLSLGPVSNFLLKPLERAAPPLRKLPASADAVVVPGGGSVDLAWAGAPAVPNAESWTRLAKGLEAAQKLNVPLVLTGGNGEPFATTLNDAEIMAEAAYGMGMPRAQVIVENRSRNTLENSHAVRKLLKGETIVLATSAYYMRRATAMFVRRGFTVIPAPTFHLVDARKLAPASFIPRAGYLANSSTAVAEWLSLAWWRIRGEI